MAWADEMSSFLTCIDPNHMVGISTEGFFSEADPQVGRRRRLMPVGAKLACVQLPACRLHVVQVPSSSPHWRLPSSASACPHSCLTLSVCS